MRQLTFYGFLSNYVRQLSVCNSNSLYKLAAEASGKNPRLKAPLFLYALFGQKREVLFCTMTADQLKKEYDEVLADQTAESVEQLLDAGSPELPEEYHKVWRTYQYAKNRNNADADTKELMRKKIKRLQNTCKLTNYRIYTDLKLNPGNVNAWLKHGVGEKVSLETARAVLQYVQSACAKSN